MVAMDGPPGPCVGDGQSQGGLCFLSPVCSLVLPGPGSQCSVPPSPPPPHTPPPSPEWSSLGVEASPSHPIFPALDIMSSTQKKLNQC